METQITKSNSNVPAFVQEKMATLEGALEYARVLCSTKMMPNHFYEKKQGSDGKYYPDYTKPKPESVVLVLQYGQEIGMSHMQAIQQLIPINQLVAIKGDGAKALIMGSGKCATWKEEEVGTGDDFAVKITAKRKDTGEEITRSFSVSDAKRAGLWITDEAASKNTALRYSPWFKFPKRMVRYRALGFISRDLFSDVLQGVYIEEEARDIETDNTKFKTEDGITVSIESKTSKVVDEVVESKPLVVKASTSKTITKNVKATEAKTEGVEPAQPTQQEEPAANLDWDNIPAEKIVSSLSAHKEEILEWLDKKVFAEIGENISSLYSTAGKNRTVGSIKTLIDTVKNGKSINSWVIEELGIPFADDNTSSQDVEEDEVYEEENDVNEAVSEVLPFELTESPRDFDSVFTLMTELNKLGIKTASIMSFISSNKLSYKSPDEFCKLADAQEFLQLIHANKA